MSYPTPSAYQEALQHPEAAFADDELKRATPRTGPLGLPRPVTGAFAAVFPMTTPGGATYAVKCFLSEADEQQARYRAIATHLAEAALPYTVDFDYQAEGIRVEGNAFPLLKMEWAEGLPLNRFVESHLEAPRILGALAEAWTAMLPDLEEAGVAHGDLQHGNVLVAGPAETPRLRLVDYDTLFVPALEGRRSAEVGHRNYQHPDRTEADFGLHLDRFPGLAVYVALRALVLRPGLWEQYNTGENVLFRASDFYDPGASPLFAALADLEDLQREVDVLRTACHLAPEDAPSLVALRSGTAEIEVPPAAETRDRRQRAPREGLARWLAPALAMGGGGLALLAAAGLWLTAVLAMLLGGGAAVVAAARGYWRQPVVRRHRRLRQEAARFAERTRNLQREEETLHRQRETVLAEREERRAERLEERRQEALRAHLKHHFIGEVRAVNGLSHKTVVRLKAAGIRNAYEATPEALEGVTKLGEKSTARLKMWRAALVERYAEEVPTALGPAEERRLRRFTERRLEQIDAEIARARRKAEAQDTERADAEKHARALPDLSFGHYVQYLLRLRASLPAPETAPAPPPAAPLKGTPPAADEPSPAAGPNGPAEEPGEQPWYAQRG